MGLKAKSIDELQRDVLRIYGEYERTGTNRWTHQTALTDMQYQVGSLAKCILQIQGDRFNEGQTIGQLHESVCDELADILAEVLFIAHCLDVDLMLAWNKMLDSDANKVADRVAVKRRQFS